MWGVGVFFSGRFSLVVMRLEGASKGVVVTVLGLAEFVEEEDHSLKAQDQHYSADEAGGVERVLVFGAGGDCCGARVGGSCGARVGGSRGARVGGSCGERHNRGKGMAALQRNLIATSAELT